MKKSSIKILSLVITLTLLSVSIFACSCFAENNEKEFNNDILTPVLAKQTLSAKNIIISNTTTNESVAVALSTNNKDAPPLETEATVVKISELNDNHTIEKSVSPTNSASTPVYNHGLLDQGLNINTETFSVPEHTDIKDKNIIVNGIVSMKFKAGQLEQQCCFKNNEKNPCFMVYSVVLSDTNEVVFQSGLIPPGYTLNSLTLAQELAPGEYPVTIKITAYSFDCEMSKLNNAAIKTVLTVE